MTNNQILNGISAIMNVFSAYEQVFPAVTDTEKLKADTIQLIDIFSSSFILKDIPNYLANKGAENPISIGSGTVKLSDSAKELIPDLKNELPFIDSQNDLTIPVCADYRHPMSVMIRVAQKDMSVVSDFAQNILLSLMMEAPDSLFRCLDMVTVGSFFTTAYNLIPKFNTRSGGKVYTTENDYAGLIDLFKQISNATLTKLGDRYADICEYNKNNKDQIAPCTAIMVLDSSVNRSRQEAELAKLIGNGAKTGMSYVIVYTGKGEFLPDNLFDFCFKVSNNSLYLNAEIPVPLTITGKDITVNALIDKITVSEQVDTVYANHPELATPYYDMEAKDCIRIPFAIDRYNRSQYFEIGGDAPPHALIAGSTGSGKSTVLHTLIMQTVCHYHPDDVEIWAIDYKAVEFGFYIKHMPPHIKVVGQDASTEFSLSLIDKLFEEYERRKRLFTENDVDKLENYRKKFGKHSMPRILVIIDEFQMMTQAVMEYNASSNYRTKLENLLRLTRAMGISFIFSSQTIASGLNGLSEASRDQIGIRLRLKHEDPNEVTATLAITGAEVSEMVAVARNQKRGQGIYKRTRLAQEHSPDGKNYEFIKTNALFISPEIRAKMIDDVNNLKNVTWQPKETIIVRGNPRISLEEKSRHPIQRFINEQYKSDGECLEWYPAAPCSLDDYFAVGIDNTADANILFVGENDSLRESVVLHSVCGFLMNPANTVTANIVIGNTDDDRTRLASILRRLHSPRLQVNTDVQDILDSIHEQKTIIPSDEGSRVYLWYGLDKLKNVLFLRRQAKENVSVEEKRSGHVEIDEAFLAGFLKATDITKPLEDIAAHAAPKQGPDISIEDCIHIVQNSVENGPENGIKHFMIFNNVKGMTKSGFVKLGFFEMRMSSTVSADDSYTLFGLSSTMKLTNEDTVVYSAGQGTPIPLRPYMMPDQAWIDAFNEAVD